MFRKQGHLSRRPDDAIFINESIIQIFFELFIFLSSKLKIPGEQKSKAKIQDYATLIFKGIVSLPFLKISFRY